MIEAKAWVMIPKLDKDKTVIFGMVPLVLCKECKHGEPGACGDGIDCDGVWHEADWFCADGVMKDD